MKLKLLRFTLSGQASTDSFATPERKYGIALLSFFPVRKERYSLLRKNVILKTSLITLTGIFTYKFKN